MTSPGSYIHMSSVRRLETSRNYLQRFVLVAILLRLSILPELVRRWCALMFAVPTAVPDL